MAEAFEDWQSKTKVQGFFYCTEEEQRRLLNQNLVASHIRELASRELPHLMSQVFLNAFTSPPKDSDSDVSLDEDKQKELEEQIKMKMM